eukprot:CAMPEP_0197835168 /NCGR_PEP_ID=MMETSP1437-20131217/24939_1 /TAXON_ID=49252 ORGANISM="Eucampia antarctica, Strain CCMP1452" /NCGR_SAMPLE_ID=MMETSP1437 /ASSEMBLY_ACC=CAM_ASM_001096 /LENGTH=163 /DNA_ID=CAMNT_0043440387 /DNA_START=203 /DNA_END=694 /DNA_ORIENTATION=+
MVTVTKTSVAELEVDEISHKSSDNAFNERPVSPINNDVIITDSCIKQIQKLASKRPNPDSTFLRVAVDPGGCSGFQYTFELESENNDESIIDPDDDVTYHPVEGVHVVVDRTTLDLIRGSTVDFVHEMIRSSFVIVGNPQSESACGCGSSFAVKNFEEHGAND